MDLAPVTIQCIFCDAVTYARVSHPSQKVFCEECEQLFAFSEGQSLYFISSAKEPIVVPEAKNLEIDFSISAGDSLPTISENFVALQKTSIEFEPAPLSASTPPSEKSTLSDNSVLYELVSRQILPEVLEEISYASPEKYSFIREIAKGGMGRVDLVRDNDLKRSVARKSLLSNSDLQRKLLRFIEEAQTTGQLEHPNIIPIYDMGLDIEGQVHFTMKYIQGKTLQNILQQIKKKDSMVLAEYSLNRLLTIFLQICHAIRFAHSKKIIHRDLKPENVMLGAFGEVIVMDWGLGKVLTKTTPEDLFQTEQEVQTLRDQTGYKTMDGVIMGTAAYMPPEQASGNIRSVDEQSDIYSLGAILYEILSLEPPFTGTSLHMILERVINATPEPPEKVAKTRYDRIFSRPKEISAIALKALSKDKHLRYQTVEALEQEIQNYLENKPILALPDTFSKKIKRLARQHYKTLILSMTVILLMGIVLSLYIFFSKQQKIQKHLSLGDLSLKKAKDRLYHSALAFRQETENEDGTSKKKGAYYFKTNAQNATPAQKEYDAAMKEYLHTLPLVAEEYRKVFDLEQNHPEAQQKLATLYFLRWKVAIQNKNLEIMKEFERQIRYYLGASYDSSKEKKEIEGLRELTVLSSPVGAKVYLFRYMDVDGLLLPYPYTSKKEHLQEDVLEKWRQQQRENDWPTTLHFSQPLGTTSAKGLILSDLEPGSYLLVLQHDRFLPFFLPFLLEHPNYEGALQYVPPKFKLSATLIPEEKASPEFTYLPKTKFVLGDITIGSEERQVREAGHIFLKTKEVTLGEYAEFLQDLYQKQDPEAGQHRPRDFSPEGQKILLDFDPTTQEMILTEYGKKSWPVAVKWQETPVRGISYRDVKSYLKWLSQKKNRSYRLPNEEEWELAARGSDGRSYSWGTEFFPGWAKLTQGYGGISVEEIQKQYQLNAFKDRSVFGVEDLNGSVAEWVEGSFESEKKESQAEENLLRIIRGNAWGLTPIGLQCAFRTSGPEDYFHLTIGFRYCYDP